MSDPIKPISPEATSLAGGAMSLAGGIITTGLQNSAIRKENYRQYQRSIEQRDWEARYNSPTMQHYRHYFELHRQVMNNLQLWHPELLHR